MLPLFCFIALTDYTETGPEEQQPAGAAQGGVQPHPLPHPPHPAALQHLEGEGGRLQVPGPPGVSEPGLQQDRRPLSGEKQGRTLRRIIRAMYKEDKQVFVLLVLH